MLCLPLVMAVEYIFALGVTLIMSAVDVYFRDLEHILGIIAMAWMFMTPIMYSIDGMSDKVQILFRLNPMTGIVQAYRDILYSGKVPDFANLAISFGTGVVLLLIGFVVFGKLKRRFSEVM